jgi:hypothetical protein
MTASTDDVPGPIFISYRREDTAYPAAWLFDRLVSRFGRAQVFKDIDSIEPGDDFGEVIGTAVGSCDVLLALIGDRWLTVTDQDGRRRLDDPDDLVRIEIEAALTRSVRVIPILVQGARMPRAGELPPSLAILARRQAHELSPGQFDADTQRLIRALDRTSVGLRPTRSLRLPTVAMRIGTDAGSDLVLVNDLGAARHHAELRRLSTGSYEITDLGSRKGTFVNGTRVKSAILTERDVISIGHSTFRIAGDELLQYVDK